MREVVLSIPQIDETQNLEIEVRINGKKKTLTYRVEIISWEGSEPDTAEKVSLIRKTVKKFDPEWKLIQIGSPSAHTIPLMFRNRHQTEGGEEES